MPGSLTSLRVHLVWSTRQRRPWLDPEWRPRLFAQLGGTAARAGGELLCAGGVRDHIHLYVECPGTLAIVHLVGVLKAGSARWIQESFAHRRDFKWQNGYGAFSVTRWADQALRDYIRTQEVYHRAQAFTTEYVGLLERHGVEYDPRDVLD